MKKARQGSDGLRIPGGLLEAAVAGCLHIRQPGVREQGTRPRPHGPRVNQVKPSSRRYRSRSQELFGVLD